MVKINNPNYAAIGEKVRKKRESLRWTQETLAEKTGYSAVHISNIETAHTKVSLSALIIIANALGTTLDELVCDDLDNVSDFRNVQYAKVLLDCTPTETKIITDAASTLKRILRKYT